MVRMVNKEAADVVEFYFEKARDSLEKHGWGTPTTDQIIKAAALMIDEERRLAFDRMGSRPVTSEDVRVSESAKSETT